MFLDWLIDSFIGKKPTGGGAAGPTRASFDDFPQDFESLALSLGEDQTFTPRTQATGRWLEEPELNRRTQILYEVDTGGFIVVEHVMGLDPRARPISDREVARTLRRNGLQLPASLLRFLDAREWDDPSRPLRGLDHWCSHHPLEVDEDLSAHETNICGLIEQVVVAGIRFIQAHREGSDTILESRYGIVRALFGRYAVCPNHWWGTKSKVPPSRTGILGLRWPDGTAEMQGIVRELQELVEPPLACLVWSGRRVDNPAAPIQEEQDLAEAALRDALPQVETLVVRLREELRRLDSGEILEELRDAKAPLKIPSEDAFAAYRMWTEEGTKQKDIPLALAPIIGRLVDPGTISRWLRQVERWRARGNDLSSSPASSPSTARFIDPAEIDLGERRDHRTPRQREKGNGP